MHRHFSASPAYGDHRAKLQDNIGYSVSGDAVITPKVLGASSSELHLIGLLQNDHSTPCILQGSWIS